MSTKKPLQQEQQQEQSNELKKEREFIPISEQRMHPWMNPNMHYMHGDIKDEEVPILIDEAIKRGIVSKENLYRALPQSNIIEIGQNAPNGIVYSLNSERLELKNFFSNEKLCVLNFGSYT
eukprot:TRINITY_DN8081_c0_g1_i1.p1 TRINITY_DN8081_c0_g1~~TRINITY_DN8081_c0_g1_i1.p1  ORF type:complete len:136 (+),score=57.86 TRINITY_DN8081_c0_g1_i1:48-410(+)